MQRGAIRILASLVLVLALIGGGYMSLANRERESKRTANDTLVAATSQLQDDRQRTGEIDRASRDAVRKAAAETEAKGKADAAGKAIADAAKNADAQAAKATATPTPGVPKPYDGPIPASCSEYTGNQAAGCALLLAAGFGLDQMPCLASLWKKESGWNTAAKNSSSGAYGIPQALPGSKMASAGADWQTSAETQIRWGLGYIKGRYGNPCGAWSHSKATGWY
ncbi:lytic transglycosylase domain-containing protein [Longispora sp. NPDC051575]|uniref:aggregation-promoting factor C-terminal-like domain-containing protein n=1 Tax=Longispora sp. NPDC051575 TaxID=3154943 RepID=UPI00343E5121